MTLQTFFKNRIFFLTNRRGVIFALGNLSYGMARNVDCGIQCERTMEFLRAALRAGWLRQDCQTIERTSEAVWYCPECKCRWDPSNPNEKFNWQLDHINTDIVRRPATPGGVYTPAIEPCTMHRHRPPATAETGGMVVFDDPGFIFNEIKETTTRIPEITKDYAEDT